MSACTSTAENVRMKYLVVTGGVVSGLGKGISISSLGVLLKSAGLRVTAIKIDPYLVGTHVMWQCCVLFAKWLYGPSLAMRSFGCWLAPSKVRHGSTVTVRLQCHTCVLLQNSDAGTMSPFEHGEVFVLNDGGEVCSCATCTNSVPAPTPACLCARLGRSLRAFCQPGPPCMTCAPDPQEPPSPCRLTWTLATTSVSWMSP